MTSNGDVTITIEALAAMIRVVEFCRDHSVGLALTNCQRLEAALTLPSLPAGCREAWRAEAQRTIPQLRGAHASLQLSCNQLLGLLVDSTATPGPVM